MIAGVQMLIWLILLAFCLFPYDWLTLARTDLDYAVLSVIAISFIYPLGIILDHMADRLLRKPEESIRKSIPGGEKSMSLLLTKINSTIIADQFDYIRTRIRITRSATVNFFLITVVTAALTLLKLGVNCSSLKIVGAEVIIGVTLTWLAYASWSLLNKTYFQKISNRYAELESVHTG